MYVDMLVSGSVMTMYMRIRLVVMVMVVVMMGGYHGTFRRGGGRHGGSSVIGERNASRGGVGAVRAMRGMSRRRTIVYFPNEFVASWSCIIRAYNLNRI